MSFFFRDFLVQPHCWVLHCLPTVSYSSPSDDTTSLCKQTICSQYIIWTSWSTVYNPGGFGHTRLQKRFRKGVQRPVQYSTMDKDKIVSAIDKTRWQVTAFPQVSLSQISRWRAKSSSLKQATWPNTIALLKGPVAFLLEVKDQLVNLVNKWHGKGIPVSCIYLVKKTWTKICMPPRRRRTKWRVDSFTVESRFCQQDSSCAEIKHFELHVAAWPDPSYGHTNRTSSS